MELIVIIVAILAIMAMMSAYLIWSRALPSRRSSRSARPARSTPSTMEPTSPPIPSGALTAERTYAPREQWETLSPGQLRAPELIDGASRSTGPVEAYRVPARLGEYEEEVELLWFTTTERAAVAFAGTSFWTNARSPEAALRAWASGRASGVRTAPR